MRKAFRGGRTSGRLPVLVAAAGVAVAGLGLVAPSAKADTPSGPYNVSPQSSQTYQNTSGVSGWADPAGPPATPCNAAECDRQTVNFSRGTSPVGDVFSLTLTVMYSSTDTTLGNCLDIAIEDSSASTVLAKQSCAPPGASITDPSVNDGASYVMEIDGDAANGAAVMAQPFTAKVSAAASAPTTGPTPTPTPPPQDVFTFTHEVSVDVQHGDGEPDVAITPNDKNIFTATPYGFSTTVSLMWKSADGGVQWDNLHGSAASDCPDPAAILLRPDCSRGGGDAEIQFSGAQSPSTQPTVQFEDLNGLDTISCAYSTNGGDTFVDLPAATSMGNPEAGTACNDGSTANATNCAAQTQKVDQNPACASLGTDRQWLQDWPKADNGTANDELFMIFDTGDQPPAGDAAMHATWTGSTWQWALSCSTVAGSSCVGGSNGAGSRPGPLVINPKLLNHISGVTGVTSGTYPTLYEFMGTNTNGTEVNVSCDGGQTWSHVTTSDGQAGSTTNDFVAGAMDSSGELYTAYTVSNDPNPWRVWFAHSTDTAVTAGHTRPGTPHVGDCSVPVQGAAWSTPVALTGPPSAADSVGATPIPGENYAVMPWLTAGSAGRVDLVYYGATAPVGLQPDNQAATWYLHMAQTLDGGATWVDEQATETPMHVKSICFSGIGCTAQTPPGGDRNLLDFFQVKPDSHGRAVIIFTDDNNSAACAPTCSPGIGLISEVMQATGPGLYASKNGGVVTPLANGLQAQSIDGDVRTADVNADVTDPANDALLAPLGHNLGGPTNEVPALDIRDLKVCTVHTTPCPVTNTNASSLVFLFTLKNLSGAFAPPSSAVVGAHTGAQWLVTWRSFNPALSPPWDLWFAEASVDPTGHLSCVAGRPLSVFNDGEPKAVEYTAAGNSEATTITGCTHTGNSLEIDVPFSDVGATSTSELYGLTGWTGDDISVPADLCTADGLTSPGNACGTTSASGHTVAMTGDIGFFDNVDETAPLDVTLSSEFDRRPRGALGGADRGPGAGGGGRRHVRPPAEAPPRARVARSAASRRCIERWAVI